MISVITADLVRSTESRLTQQQRIRQLQQNLTEINELPDNGGVLQEFTIFRGDAFQGALQSVQSSLRVAMFLRASIRSTMGLDVRQAIGIGLNAELIENSAMLSTGEAFIHSGHLLDELSAHKRLQRKISVASGDQRFDDEFNTCFDLLEVTSRRWTDKEAEGIKLRLKGLNQAEIAKQLNINQSAVNKRLQSAGWFALDSLLRHWNKRTLQRFVNEDTND
jgi:predicted DNA-binding protein (UPF0251 family)